MSLIIIPGIHDPELTTSFVASIADIIKQQYFILPTQYYAPYSPVAINQWLDQQNIPPAVALSIIAFSAGVVGGIGAALTWQFQGKHIRSFIAFDGWGMPLLGNFPLYRISHDYFTHWSSGLLGGGKQGFFADSPVSHLELWRSPAEELLWLAVID